MPLPFPTCSSTPSPLRMPPRRHAHRHPGRRRRRSAVALAALAVGAAAAALAAAGAPGPFAAHRPVSPLAPAVAHAQEDPAPAALDWTVTAPAPAGTFYDPVGLAVAPDGTVVVADTGNARLVRMARSGAVVAVWGGPGIGDGQLVEPLGVDIAPDGTVFVADQGRGDVARWSADGRWLGAWRPSLPDDLVPSWSADRRPEDVALLPDGTVAVRIGSGVVARYTADGTRLAAWAVDDRPRFAADARLDPLAALHRVARPSAGILGATRVMSSWSDPRHFLAAGPDGTLWVDATSEVRRFGPDGQPRGVVGGYGESPGRFAGWGVAGIGALPDGGAWVVDSYSGRLNRFRADGSLATWFVAPGPYPRDVAAASDGSVFVTTVGRRPDEPGALVRLNADGVLLSVWGDAIGDVDPGGGIGVAPDGGIVVADPAGDRLLRYGADGRFLGAWGAPGSSPGLFNDPAGLQFVGANGTFAVADSGNDRLQVIEPTGAVRGAFGRRGAGAGQFAFPRDVVTDAWGYLAVADSGNARLAYTHLYGNWGGESRPSAGALGGRGLAAPSGVAVVAGADILDHTTWIADTGNDRLVRDDYPDLRAIGGPGADVGQFSAPRDIVADPSRRIYVADTGNHRVQRLSDLGQPQAAWGGFGRAPGRFDRPTALAFDRLSRLLVLDLGNRRVQRLDGAGRPTAVFALPDNEATVAGGGRLVALPGGGYAFAGRDSRLGGTRIVWLDEAGRRVREVRLPLAAGGLDRVHELGAAADGGLWLTTQQGGRVVGLAPDGSTRRDWQAPPAPDEDCVGIAGAPDGGTYRLMGTYPSKGRVERWTADGAIVARYPLVHGNVSLGPASGGNQEGRLGVATDGSLFVLGYTGSDYQIWHFAADGRWMNAWPVGGITGAGDVSPQAIAVTADNDVLLATEEYRPPADGIGNRVYRYAPNGALLSVWRPPTDGCAAPRSALDRTPSLASIAARPGGGVLVSWYNPRCLEAWSPPASASSEAWRLSIYPDADLAERPVIITELQGASVAWPADMSSAEPPALAADAAWPAVPPRGASIRLERRFTTAVTSTLRLDTRADGGVRLWVDGRLRIDDWLAASVERPVAIDALPPGRHHVRVEHRPAGDSVRLTVGDPSSPLLPTWTPLPIESPSATSTPAATATRAATNGGGHAWLPWAGR